MNGSSACHAQQTEATSLSSSLFQIVPGSDGLRGATQAERGGGVPGEGRATRRRQGERTSVPRQERRQTQQQLHETKCPCANVVRDAVQSEAESLHPGPQGQGRPLHSGPRHSQRANAEAKAKNDVCRFSFILFAFVSVFAGINGPLVAASIVRRRLHQRQFDYNVKIRLHGYQCIRLHYVTAISQSQ